MPNHSVTCGYARVSKADDEARNLVTKLQLLQTHGVPPNLVYCDVATGRPHERSDWQELVEVVRPGDTILVAFLDRFSRNFEEGSASRPAWWMPPVNGYGTVRPGARDVASAGLPP